MNNLQQGVVIIDGSCFRFLEKPSVLERVRKDMRITDLQIRLSSINILEAVKTQDTKLRSRLLKIIRNVSEGRPFLPWPLELIKKSGETIARGDTSFWSGESGLETKVYENSVSDKDVNFAKKRMDSLESNFIRMHDTARKKLKGFLRGNNSPKTGHYTYNYLKTLEIIFNMDEWQIW